MATKDQAVSSRVPATPALAHVRRNDDGSFAIHDLEEYLRAVNDLSASVLLSVAVKLLIAYVIRGG
jgi:hypothetical protein